jgi:manganese/iron transport system permease protein/iron/zinc/copper transport system permease protein
VWALAAISVFTVAVVLTNYRALLFATFDPEVADVSGVRVARTDALLMLVLSLSILATLTVIGVTLVAATLVIPAVVARMLTNRFSRMLWLSTIIGAGCGFVGMNLSYHLNVPSGTTIVLTGSVVFAVVLAGTGGRRLQRAAQLDGHAEPTPSSTPLPTPTLPR